MLYWWLGRRTWWIKGGRLYSIHGCNTLEIPCWYARGRWRYIKSVNWLQTAAIHFMDNGKSNEMSASNHPMRTWDEDKGSVFDGALNFKLISSTRKRNDICEPWPALFCANSSPPPLSLCTNHDFSSMPTKVWFITIVQYITVITLFWKVRWSRHELYCIFNNTCYIYRCLWCITSWLSKTIMYNTFVRELKRCRAIQCNHL